MGRGCSSENWFPHGEGLCLVAKTVAPGVKTVFGGFGGGATLFGGAGFPQYPHKIVRGGGPP